VELVDFTELTEKDRTHGKVLNSWNRESSWPLANPCL